MPWRNTSRTNGRFSPTPREQVVNRSAATANDPLTGSAVREPFTGLLDAAANLQHEYESRTSIEQRKAKGQYFTPPEVCAFMAGRFSEPKGDRYRFLDPGAGVGSLSAALCERLSR